MSRFQQLHQPTGRFIHFDNKDYLFLGGTAYLGLLVNADYIALYKEGINKYGLNNGTSRSNNVQLGIYDEGESVLADRFGFEAAAVFSSGYLAAQAAVQTFSRGRKVYYAPGSHPALWVGENRNPIESFVDWSNRIVKEINASDEQEFLIISNTLDNLTPALYDFRVFASIDSAKNVMLLLDDSHGIAVMRQHQVSVDISGLGFGQHIKVVVVASLAKGLGTDAGLMLGASDFVEEVKLHPIFMGASPASPAAMYALLRGGDIYVEEFVKLQSNVASMARLLSSDSRFSFVAGFPVFTSMDSGLAAYLLKSGVLISSFPYPLPSSPMLNRVVVSSLHEKEDLEKVSRLCQSYVL